MDEKRTSNVWVVVAIFLVVTLPIGYVLSIGPVEAYYCNSPTSASGWVVAFYSPLAWLANSTHVTKEWLLWYVNLWR